MVGNADRATGKRQDTGLVVKDKPNSSHYLALD